MDVRTGLGRFKNFTVSNNQNSDKILIKIIVQINDDG